MEYEAVIGLETHVQLKTLSKMWCGCANEFGASPNTNVCPVCLGMPGVLPVANEEALRLTALTGLLLNGKITPFAKFDRKNYFYPDASKNYQVTQYDQPSTLADLKFQPTALAELIDLVDSGKISSKIAQDVFAEMFVSGEAPAAIVEKKGLLQVSDTGAIEKFCDEAIAANPKSAEDFRAGKVAALNFLKGQVMKLSKGKANTNLVGEILERKLKA